MLRQLTYCGLVAAFSVFAVFGLKGWMSGPSTAEPEPPPGDEIPLQVGYINAGPKLVEYGFKGYPFEPLRGEIIAARRELPPDPAPVSAEDEKKRVERVGSLMKYKVTAGTYTWPQFKEMAPKAVADWDIDVFFPNPQAPDTLTVSIPLRTTKDGEWTGFELFSHIKVDTGAQVAAIGTCQGIAVGVPEALTRAQEEGALVGYRRRVLAENLDPRLDVLFRPDLRDASVLAFIRSAEAQTGIPIVMDASIWEKAPGISWRGDPRKLRDALDEVCKRFRWFWRFRSGRVYILPPLTET